ncbi:PAS and ANTAR domain-containing protein [Oerskovia sp. KBS0722]|uniref:PAS and ANTAR domain-containing protein n=1 Tax=Oerskovia sp. KBS0722 TaxID=1179673 RepID=UPI00110D286B|nr:PAS and ANTAR domain-containing protein [Oerskovia sp. KBS0722]QDW62230.1 ANTAR domain-containing protein [Oerskovia sp. KBS0722]
MTTSYNPSRRFDPELAEALLRGAPQIVGQFILDLSDQSWWWSDELYAMHGFRPGEIMPTTALMIAHKHPEDRERVEDVLFAAVTTGEPFSSVHRIVDAQGRTRTLGVVGRGRLDRRTGETTHVSGYFIDLTTTQRELAQREATAAIRASSASRSTIEQAKGAVMAIYGLPADEAFDLMCHHSSVNNEPLRDLSRRLVAELTVGGGEGALRRADLDRFFEGKRPVR